MPPHNNHRSGVHRTAIFLGVVLVLILAHIVLLLAQSNSPSRARGLRAEGQWAAVRHSLGLPPLPAHVKARGASKIPPMALRISSRFDLKRKRALEESGFEGPPPQLYFAADALIEEIIADDLAEADAETESTIELKGTKRRGRNSRSERGAHSRIA